MKNKQHAHADFITECEAYPVSLLFWIHEFGCNLQARMHDRSEHAGAEMY
jgi:hypothetical protein